MGVATNPTGPAASGASAAAPRPVLAEPVKLLTASNLLKEHAPTNDNRLLTHAAARRWHFLTLRTVGHRCIHCVALTLADPQVRAVDI